MYDHEGYDNIIMINTTIQQHNRYKHACVQAHVYRIILQLLYISREYIQSSHTTVTGLLKVEEGGRTLSAIKQNLQLYNQVVDEKNPTDTM